jgi:hypothetical protein
MLQDALIQDRISILKGQKAFYLAGTSPPNEKMSSPCPPCHCGEKPILDNCGLFYVLQGVLFLLTGTILGRLSFRFNYKFLPILGACFILYAMVIYPLLGLAFGHSYPRIPLFGVAPCPTTIFTFGILLWATKSVSAYLLIIPFLWSLVGISAALNLRVPQDYGLVVAGVLGTTLILIQNRKAKRSAQLTPPHA